MKNFLTTVFLFAAFTKAVFPQSEIPDPDMWVTDFPIHAIAVDGNYTYIGGNFSYVGPNTGHGARLTTTSDSPDLTFPKVNGNINVVVTDGSGGWFIGGTFTKVGTYDRNRIARINSDGTVDAAWNPNPNNTVNTIAISGSDIYVGGTFSSIGGQSRNRIAKLNYTTGAADPTWNPNPNSTVNVIVTSGSDIYAGGLFTSIGGQARSRIARLNNTTGAADLTWNPNANQSVNEIAISGSDIYAGGTFTSIGGQSRNRIAKLNNTDGAADLTWNPNSNQSVISIAISGSDIYIGGTFTSIGVETRNRIAKLNNTDGAADPTWNPNSNQSVISIAISGSDIYVGGSFTSIGGEVRNRIAKLNNTTGAADLTWNPNASLTVNSIAISGSDIYVGGAFNSIGGETRQGIAKLDNTTGAADQTWNPPTSNESIGVNAIAISGSDIYVGGMFGSIGGQMRNRIAKLNNTDGAVDLTWNPNASFTVNSIAISGSDIYVGGRFTSIGGQPRNYIAKLNNTDGAADLTWNPNASAFVTTDVRTIAISGSDIYVGGNFTSIGGITRNYIAKLNNTTGVADLTWNPNASSFVRTIAISGSDIYVGGEFTSIGGQTRNRIAKLNNTDGAADLTWNPNASNGLGAITINGSDIYVGGGFTTIGGQLRNRIAKLNITTGATDLTWNPNVFQQGIVGTFAWVNAIAISGNDIYVGGDFTTIGGSSQRGLALFRGESASNTPPQFVTPTPDEASTITIYTGSQINFTVSASDPDAGDNVILTANGLPSGSSMVLPASGNPASSDFSWTPSVADVGNYSLTFTATDNSSAAATRSFTIEVIAQNTTPYFVYPTPDEDSTITVYTGSEIIFTVSSEDADTGDIVTLTAIGLPSGSSMILPASGNPASSDFSWTPSVADVGTYSLTFTATDNSLAAAIRSFTVEVIELNVSPLFISPTPECGTTLTVEEGSPINFTIAAEDLNSADIINLSVSGLPAGSSMDPSLPANGNPVSSVFSWTPSSADVGNHTIVFTADDNSNDPVICSLLVEVSPMPPPPTNYCPLSQGYWKTHTNNWPASALPMMLGTLNTYNQSELLSLFNAAPRGDASIILAHQLMAAKLNIANGSPLPTEVEDAIEEADVAIGELAIPAGIKAQHPLRATMIELSSLLDDYNNKLLTPNCVQMPKNGTGKPEVITEYALFSNYPNPFNPSTKISWQSPVDGHQTLKVFDVLGNEVAVLVDEFRPAGRYEATFDASNLASGIYIYKLQAGDFVQMKKMILMK